MKPIYSEDEIRQAAEKCAEVVIRAVDLIVAHFENAAAHGVDPNGLLASARDGLVEAGFGLVQSANIVRLAIHKLNSKHGRSTYTGEELHIICERISHAA
jgi:hypothetical protein